MAGTPMGARAPAFPANPPAADSAAILVPQRTRSRVCHGVFSLGGELTVVYSSRRVFEAGKGVQLVLGHDGPAVKAPSLSPTQARHLARALVCAADAAEAVREGRV